MVRHHFARADAARAEINLNFTFGFRPAVQVLFAGVLVFLIAAARRLIRRRRPASAGAAA